MKGGVCVKHGAKKKTCSHKGCTNNAQKGGVCIRHGAVVKRGAVKKPPLLICLDAGTNPFPSLNHSKESDGSVPKAARIGQCSVEGCTYKADDSGTCSTKHKGYKHCKEEGCTKQARKGGVMAILASAISYPQAIKEDPVLRRPIHGRIKTIKDYPMVHIDHSKDSQPIVHNRAGREYPTTPSRTHLGR